MAFTQYVGQLTFSQMQDHSIQFPYSKVFFFIFLHLQSGRVVRALGLPFVNVSARVIFHSLVHPGLTHCIKSNWMHSNSTIDKEAIRL